MVFALRSPLNPPVGSHSVGIARSRPDCVARLLRVRAVRLPRGCVFYGNLSVVSLHQPQAGEAASRALAGFWAAPDENIVIWVWEGSRRSLWTYPCCSVLARGCVGEGRGSGFIMKNARNRSENDRTHVQHPKTISPAANNRGNRRERHAPHPPSGIIFWQARVFSCPDP